MRPPHWSGKPHTHATRDRPEDRQDPAADKLKPYGIEENDPRWSVLVCDMLEHLHQMHRRFEEMLMKSIDQHQQFEIERKKDRLETHESIREMQLRQTELNTLLTLLETKLP